MSNPGAPTSIGYRTKDADEVACLVSLRGVAFSSIKPAHNLYIPGSFDYREGRPGQSEFVIECSRAQEHGGITPAELGAAYKAGDEDEKLDKMLADMEAGEAVPVQKLKAQIARSIVCYGNAVLENRRAIERGRTKPRDQVLVKTEKGRVLLPRTDWTPANRRFARDNKVI